MFKRENSKTLTALNIFLLIQIICGALALFSAVANALFPIWYTPKTMEWAYPLFVMLVPAAIAFLANAPMRSTLFDVRLPFTEKLFAFLCLQTINGLVCGALANFVAAAIEPVGSVPVWPVLCLLICACVFATGMFVSKIIRLFRSEFSGLANVGNLIFMMSALADLSWAINEVFVLANYKLSSFHFCYNQENQIKQQIFIATCMTILFVVILTVVYNGAIKGAKKRKELQEKMKEQYAQTGYTPNAQYYNNVQPAYYYPQQNMYYYPQYSTQGTPPMPQNVPEQNDNFDAFEQKDEESYAGERFDEDHVDERADENHEDERINEDREDELRSMKEEIEKLKEQLAKKSRNNDDNQENEE